MIQIMFPVFIVILIGSSSALPDACSSSSIFEMDTLKAVHLTSFCIIESIVEEANSLDSDYGRDIDCNAKDLYKTGDQQDESNLSLMSCLLKATREPGDSLPLSPHTVKQRIATAAANYVDEFDVEDDCSANKLKRVIYTDALDRIDEFGACMIYQTLRDLIHPEKLDHYDFAHSVPV